MTFLQFKKLCELKNKGHMTLPETVEDYAPLIQESLEYIANNCIPIHLVTEDLTQPDLRFINIEKIIRMPKAPTADDGEIDIDETLVYSVAYDLLGNKTADLSEAAFYFSKRDDAINKYQWNNFKLLQELSQ